MTVEQIIKLIDAGYTKEDIQAMMEPKASPAPEVKPEPINEKQEIPAEQPEEKKPDSEPVNKEMLQELRELKKAVFSMNIMNSSQPAQPESVDDILAKALKEG